MISKLTRILQVIHLSLTAPRVARVLRQNLGWRVFWFGSVSVSEVYQDLLTCYLL